MPSEPCQHNGEVCISTVFSLSDDYSQTVRTDTVTCAECDQVLEERRHAE